MSGIEQHSFMLGYKRQDRTQLCTKGLLLLFYEIEQYLLKSVSLEWKHQKPRGLPKVRVLSDLMVNIRGKISTANQTSPSQCSVVVGDYFSVLICQTGISISPFCSPYIDSAFACNNRLD